MTRAGGQIVEHLMFPRPAVSSLFTAQDRVAPVVRGFTRPRKVPDFIGNRRGNSTRGPGNRKLVPWESKASHGR